MSEIPTSPAAAKGVFKLGPVLLGSGVFLDDAIAMELAEHEALLSAIRLLSRVHTRDDWQAGFTVEACASDLPCDRDGYVGAWETLRRAAGLPVDPACFSEDSHAA